jgi:hypothetical protein
MKNNSATTEKNKNPFTAFFGWLGSLFDKLIAQVKRFYAWLKGSPKQVESLVDKARQDIHENIFNDYQAEKQKEKEANFIQQSDAILTLLNEQVEKKQDLKIGRFKKLHEIQTEAKATKLSDATCKKLQDNYEAATKLSSAEMEAQYIALSNATLEEFKKALEQFKKALKEKGDANLVEIKVINDFNKIIAIIADAKCARMSQPTVKKLVENHIEARALREPSIAQQANNESANKPPALSASETALKEAALLKKEVVDLKNEIADFVTNREQARKTIPNK